MKKLAILTLCLLYLMTYCSFNSWAQNTIGLIDYDPDQTIAGYNLIYPDNQSTVYLLNTCGEVVHRWEDTDEEARPGPVAYLLPDGRLLRTKSFSPLFSTPSFGIGGSGGVVQLLSWNNEVEWTYVVADSVQRQHHDIHPLPNGHLLILAYEVIDSSRMTANGFDYSNANLQEIWSEKIIEIDPQTDSIHWEWHLWDHIIQENDPTKLNFGDVAVSPGRVHLNYQPPTGLNRDWIHANSLDYNEELDQILISARNFNELWIIDHSTTTEEAATSSGGNSNKGGDLLWRWGATAAYNQGTSDDQQLFWNHDAQWIDDFVNTDYEYFGAIAVFNNFIDYDVQNGRSLGQILQPVWDASTQSYVLQDGDYLPQDFSLSFSHPDSVRNFSSAGSSMQVMGSGHVLMCVARQGRLFELNSEQEVVWEYLTPLRNGANLSQGSILNISDNFTFRTSRYPSDYLAFEGRDLSPQGYLELDANEDFCMLVSSDEPALVKDRLIIFPNPAKEMLNLHIETAALPLPLDIHDGYGRLCYQIQMDTSNLQLDINNW
ncbi:MAG: aryl-sulfate sulfotransferase, partial [Bacteroidota bacterium]